MAAALALDKLANGEMKKRENLGKSVLKSGASAL